MHHAVYCRCIITELYVRWFIGAFFELFTSTDSDDLLFCQLKTVQLRDIPVNGYSFSIYGSRFRLMQSNCSLHVLTWSRCLSIQLTSNLPFPAWCALVFGVVTVVCHLCICFSPFAVSPHHMTLPPGGRAEVLVTFQPMRRGTQYGELILLMDSGKQ